MLEQELEKNFKCKNSIEYFTQINKGLSEEDILLKLDDEIFRKEFQIVDKIISLQVSYFLLRRIPGGFGSYIDDLVTLISDQKRIYKEYTNKDYIDLNDDVDY